jgi:hypothetical protein
MTARTLNNYTKGCDLSSSLEDAMKSLKIAEEKINPLNPGKRTALNSYRAYVEIGYILNDKYDDEIVAKLENRFNKSSFLLKLRIAWALCIVYKKQNKTEMLDKYKKYIENNAPYSILIKDI